MLASPSYKDGTRVTRMNRKQVYMVYRRHLECRHRFRRDSTSFDSTFEMLDALCQLTGLKFMFSHFI